METLEILAIIVFIITYLLIAVNRTPWFEIKRSYAALLGAALMLLIGALSLTDAFDSIDFKVLLLLLGMMTLVAGLEYTGFFTLISEAMLRYSGNGAKLLLMIMCLSALLSAIALNDAIVLMFTPIVIRCCHRLNANPIPYLVGLMMSANIGSIATAVGNPQNAYIASHANIDFGQFCLYSLPIAVSCLAVTYVLLYLIFRKSFSKSYEYQLIEENDKTIDTRRLRIMIAIVVLTFVGFVMTGMSDIELYQVALVAGSASLIVVCTSSVKDTVWVVKKVDWHILLFFIGLFVLIGGASRSGLISDLASMVPGFGAGETPDAVSLSVFSVVLSNLVSNVPAVMLIMNMMPSADLMLCITLAASSTLAGNTTLLGSAANIIVAERSERYGINIDFFRFMAVGVVVTVVTICVMLLCIKLMFIN